MCVTTGTAARGFSNEFEAQSSTPELFKTMCAKCTRPHASKPIKIPAIMAEKQLLTLNRTVCSRLWYNTGTVSAFT